MVLVYLLLIVFGVGVISLCSNPSSSMPKIFCGIGLFAGLILLSVTGVEVLAEREPLQFTASWISTWNINFHLAMDRFSFAMSFLTVVMGILAWWIAKPTERGNTFYAAIAWSVFTMLGLFMSADVFLFFIFWELALLPIYWLLVTHGGKRARAALMRFVIYTQLSGLILLVAIIGLVYTNFAIVGSLSFDYNTLRSASITGGMQAFLLAAFVIAFLIKLPSFPFHSWMPDLFCEAPISAIIVGMLVKTGAYGLVRFSYDMFPEASTEYSLHLMFLGAFSVLYGAVVAYRQTDPKRMIAYGTMSHAGLLLVGIFSQAGGAFFGVFFLIITQALSTGGMLMVIERLYRHNDNISLVEGNGLLSRGPKFSTVLLIFVLAGIGFPLFGNFVGEWAVLWSAFVAEPVVAIILSLSIVIGAVYSLRLYQRLCLYDAPKSPLVFTDLTTSELSVYAALIIFLVATGVCPSLLVELYQPSSHPPSIASVLQGAP